MKLASRLQVAGEHDPVDAVRRNLLHPRREVVGERCPDALCDVAAERAELGDEAGDLRPTGRIVLADRHGVPPPESAVGVGAEPGRALRGIRCKTEEIRGRTLERRRLLAARRRERDLRLFPGVLPNDEPFTGVSFGPTTMSAPLVLDDSAERVKESRKVTVRLALAQKLNRPSYSCHGRFGHPASGASKLRAPLKEGQLGPGYSRFACRLTSDVQS